MTTHTWDDARVQTFVVAGDDPEADDVRALLDTHLAFGRRHSPPEDVHALDRAGRVTGDISYFTVREDGRLLGVGALKRIDDRHAEIKSMHTAETARGRGVGRTMLQHLIGVARAGGCSRLSLETGSVDAFAPARALYASAGFTPCAPFGDYRDSPNSAYMTLDLDG